MRLINFCWTQEIRPIMGERRVTQEQLFYGFSLERHVPADHLPRKIDRFVDLSEVRAHLEPFFSETGRPSVAMLVNMIVMQLELDGSRSPPD